MPRNRGKSVAVPAHGGHLTALNFRAVCPVADSLTKIKLVAEIKRGNRWKRAGTVRLRLALKRLDFASKLPKLHVVTVDQLFGVFFRRRRHRRRNQPPG